MASKSDVRVISPAGWLEIAAVAPRGANRKRWMYQARVSHTAAAYVGGELLAVIALYPEEERRLELCTRFRPGAGRHIRRLIHLCQLRLRQLADHGVVVIARISREDRTAGRMHRAAGFEPIGEDGRLWQWRV